MRVSHHALRSTVSPHVSRAFCDQAVSVKRLSMYPSMGLHGPRRAEVALVGQHHDIHGSESHADSKPSLSEGFQGVGSAATQLLRSLPVRKTLDQLRRSPRRRIGTSHPRRPRGSRGHGQRGEGGCIFRRSQQALTAGQRDGACLGLLRPIVVPTLAIHPSPKASSCCARSSRHPVSPSVKTLLFW